MQRISTDGFPRALCAPSVVLCFLLVPSTIGAWCNGTVRSFESNSLLPLANVSACSESVLTDSNGHFALQVRLPCDCRVEVWARQYLPFISQEPPTPSDVDVALIPRPIPGFPATDWIFEGWPVEAQTGPVPGSPGPIRFLAHPSAYRVPSGDRIFMTSTANARAGPGWTQGYWLGASASRAESLPYELVNRSNPAMAGTAFTGRMTVVDGRLLMLIGMGDVTLLENKNLEDPSNPSDWKPAEGNGRVVVDYAGAPTEKHEDYRFHHFDQGRECSGSKTNSGGGSKLLKNWLFVIPDGVGQAQGGERGKPGRACGRMGFASVSGALNGPYTYCGFVEMPDPQGTADPGGPDSNCDSWPGDLIEASDGALYFVNGWGNIYKSPPGTLAFKRLGNATIARPAPLGSWDDLHQIEFTFLPPRNKDGRWSLFHASYSTQTSDHLGRRADYGYKQAIGMYSFKWE